MNLIHVSNKRMAKGVMRIVVVFLATVCVILMACATEDTDIQERCTPAPQAIIDKINSGLTAAGETRVVNVSMVENNNDRPWRFFGARFEGPGFDGDTGVWATASLDLNSDALIVAADTLAQEFSIWDKPGGGDGFASQFDDEIDAAQRCVNA